MRASAVWSTAFSRGFMSLGGSLKPAKPMQCCSQTPDPRKGIREAVRAFGHPDLRDTELHVLGDVDSPFVRALKAEATPNIRWLGRQGTTEIAEALARAWCLVLPTYADTSPNVVKEARVVGLPVVTTHAGGQSDYVRDGVDGFVVRVKVVDEPRAPPDAAFA